jgi:hypothetical protein
VKILNMSTTGALIEGAVLPGVGTLVQLIRGTLIVHALVAWSAEVRCGLKFSGGVDVPQWRANPTNTEQQRVDEVVRLVKAGAVPLPARRDAEFGGYNESPEASTQLSVDLRRASELLEHLGAALASDPDVVVRHGPKLQNLDIAMQVIGAIETIVAGKSDLNIDRLKLAGLRRSADQAFQRSV